MTATNATVRAAIVATTSMRARRHRTALHAALLGALALVAAAALAQAPREVHGSGDAFSEPGVALAWGVLRGTSEATTTVVLRVAADPQAYAWLSVIGVDPFTKAEEPLQRAMPVAGPVDVRVPRARYAELPRTEIRLFGTAAAAQAGTPALVVFYLGVPDTTPEFADAATLDAYLAERLVHAGGREEPR
jgi:hypothetical protein